MGICWWCYWGWPKPVAEIYERALKDLNGDWFPLRCGPAHIVWDDENWDSAQWCLDNFGKYSGDYSIEDLAIVRCSLEELASLPQSDWDVCPPDYDGENPVNYPPTVEMVEI